MPEASQQSPVATVLGFHWRVRSSSGVVPRAAKSDYLSLSEGFDRTHIYGTHLPVEEPSTASIAGTSYV
jgi:hypothetical protein